LCSKWGTQLDGEAVLNAMAARSLRLLPSQLRQRSVLTGNTVGNAAYFAGSTVVVLSLVLPSSFGIASQVAKSTVKTFRILVTTSRFGTAKQVVKSTVETFQVRVTTSSFGTASQVIGSIVLASYVTVALAAYGLATAVPPFKLGFPSN
jgi:RNase P/RNase MRP subunit p29